MIEAEAFVGAARARGFALWAGVPCSYLTPFINYVIGADGLRYVAAANEGDAAAIAAGAELAGARAIVMFQNSGLGNAVNPLTSLCHTFRIPVLVITTLRGEPGGPKDEPQHELMGAITTRMLELMQIPWEYFPVEADAVAPALERAVAHMDKHGTPYALAMRKGSVADYKLQGRLEPRPTYACGAGPFKQPPTAMRGEMLCAVQEAVQRDSDAVIATTGYTGRELYACDDRANQLYFVGSMGCVSSLGLGLALTQPERRVVVLDGDGAALMRMGALATIGYERPPNLFHVLLDNEMHESTGGQATVSHSIDFCALAAACGYERTVRLTTPTELKAALAGAGRGLTFVHARIRPGTPADLPRPKVTPAQVAQRLRGFLKQPA
jgi:phosphonopyruvate decarboxylase